jgi:hypothetical protein
MPNPPSATKPSLASALYPSLSREARQREAAEAKWRAEQKQRNQRTARHLEEAIDALRRERGQ